MKQILHDEAPPLNNNLVTLITKSKIEKLEVLTFSDVGYPVIQKLTQIKKFRNSYTVCHMAELSVNIDLAFFLIFNTKIVLIFINISGSS